MSSKAADVRNFRDEIVSKLALNSEVHNMRVRSGHIRGQVRRYRLAEIVGRNNRRGRGSDDRDRYCPVNADPIGLTLSVQRSVDTVRLSESNAQLR